MAPYADPDSRGRPVLVLEIISRSVLHLFDDWSWELGGFQLGSAPVWGVFLRGIPDSDPVEPVVQPATKG